jgi:regulator of RNase E activity RraB
VKTDRQKALDLIEEGANEARRIDVSDVNRPRALLAIANALSVIDVGRIWDAAFDAVKAANSIEEFTGEDGEIVLKFSSKSQSSVSNHDVNDFDVAGIFRILAEQDYDRAVELARGFQGEGPRAVATIAIARAVLQPKKAGN